MHKIPLLLALLVLALAPAAGAGAQHLYLNDEAQTPGTTTDYVVVSQDNVAASYTSAEFDIPASRLYAPQGYKYMLVIYTTADCQTSCSHQLQIQAQAPDGTWFLWGAPAAATTNTTTRHLYGPGLVAGSDASEIATYNGRGIPEKLRIRIFRSTGSGTVDPTVQVMLW